MMRPRDERFELAIGIAGISVLVLGCMLVLRPFISALAWGGVLAYASWPIYLRIRHKVGGRATLAALLTTLMLATAFVLPLILVGTSMADAGGLVVDRLKGVIELGVPPPPAWIGDIPIIGGALLGGWQDVSGSSTGLFDLIQPYLATARDFAIQLSLGLGGGLVELTFSVISVFFILRQGEMVVETAEGVGRRIAGDRTKHLLEVAGATIKGVVYGIVGTALVQALLAWIGFWVAGLQGAFPLAVATFFLALLPMGPPFIWAPLAIWLISQGSMGYGIFLGLWGLLVISGVDNVLRPYLISQSSNLSFALVFIGVIGGALAFGFLGIFLGPVLLAVGTVALRDWIGRKQSELPVA